MTQIKGLWNRDFIIALVGYFSLFMSISLFFIFPLFFEHMNVPKGRIGMIMGVHSLMAIFIRPFFGRLIDIRGRKKISLFGIAFLIFTVPFFHFINDAGVLPIILRALTGIGWGISMTATITICSDLAPVSRLAKSMGIIGVAGLLSIALGPLLAEELVNIFGFGGLYNASLLFLVISFVCIVLTKEVIELNNNYQNIKSQGFHLGIPLFAVLMISSLPMLHGAVRGAVSYFIALYGKSIPLERVGPFFVFFSLAAILTRIFFGDLSDRYGRKKIIFPAACIIGFNLFLVSQVHSFWMFILTGFIGGLGQGLLFPALSTYVIDVFGRENKGFALSLYLTFFDVGMGVGAVFFGWISDYYGYRTMYLTAGAIFLLVSLLFLWKAPSPNVVQNE
ncbi:MAG: MFS transporter [Candidatus Aminicenantes bacterium]|nr:MFS transporter [Candidatus Aminicenantes bacterium]